MADEDDRISSEARRYRGGVTIELHDIWRELVRVRDDVRGVKQSVDESIRPTLADTGRRVATLELRVYAIIAGLIAAFGAGKGLGLL